MKWFKSKYNNLVARFVINQIKSKNVDNEVLLRVLIHHLLERIVGAGRTELDIEYTAEGSSVKLVLKAKLEEVKDV